MRSRPVDKDVETVDKLGSKVIFSNIENSPEENILGIFAKEPISGTVKTRLSPPLELEESAELYRVCLEETVDRITASGYRSVLFYEGEREYFRRAFPSAALHPQGEGDLGERMSQALAFLLLQGDKAILLGSDSPDLPLPLVDEAFSLLDRSDFVTAPSEDGGYVLVGTKGTCPDMFREIPWSTAEVLEVTRQRAEDLDIRYAETGGWEDVDNVASLQQLIRRSPHTATARYAKKFLSRFF